MSDTVSATPFEVVSDDLRSKPRDTQRAEWILAVLEGKTIRVPKRQEKLGGYYKVFSRENVRLRTKADGDSTIVWAEPKAEPTKTK